MLLAAGSFDCLRFYLLHGLPGVIPGIFYVIPGLTYVIPSLTYVIPGLTYVIPGLTRNLLLLLRLRRRLRFRLRFGLRNRDRNVDDHRVVILHCMALERDRPQADAAREDVQPLFGDEEDGVLARGAQAAQPRQHDGLADFQHGLHLRKELRDVGGGRLPGDGVRGGVEVDQKVVFQAVGTERTTPVGRIDGEALVGEGRRDHLGNERADPGQSHLVVPDDQFTYHP